MSDRRLRILVLSGHYPTSAAPLRGLWVERMVQAAAVAADVRVIVPIPWVPPLITASSFSRFRNVPRREQRGSVEIYFPRVPASIENHFHGLDAVSWRRSVLSLAKALHRESPFDLIHAHFIYPEGVVASQIGRALGIPVMTSEHALWTPWLIDRARVGRQVTRALPDLCLVAAVSAFQQADIETITRGRVTTTVLPNVVDDQTFTPDSRPRASAELLYVGLLRRVKRVDVLLRALAVTRRRYPELRLRILAANAFQTYRSDLREIHALIDELDLHSAVTFVAGAAPSEVADAMRHCAFVVVSSTRRETFCSVAAEALACGTPLVCTRCGGPEEFVTEDDGVMVAPDDPSALAEGILRALETRSRFDGAAMSARIVSRFGRAAWREQAMDIYESLVRDYRGGGRGSA